MNSPHVAILPNSAHRFRRCFGITACFKCRNCFGRLRLDAAKGNFELGAADQVGRWVKGVPNRFGMARTGMPG